MNLETSPHPGILKILKAGEEKIFFDIRHKSIVDAIPFFALSELTVLDVGCGDGPVSRLMKSIGWQVDAVDIKRHESWDHDGGVNFIEGDFLTAEGLQDRYAVVMCSEVLEHLPAYGQFLRKMISLATERVIVTVPFENSFDVPGPPPEGHCNYWSWEHIKYVGKEDGKIMLETKNIKEFVEMSAPYSVSISTIRTKPKDLESGTACFLIVIDKRQWHRAIGGQ